jgi:hypothetical protein
LPFGIPATPVASQAPPVESSASPVSSVPDDQGFGADTPAPVDLSGAGLPGMAEGMDDNAAAGVPAPAGAWPLPDMIASAPTDAVEVPVVPEAGIAPPATVPPQPVAEIQVNVPPVDIPFVPPTPEAAPLTAAPDMPVVPVAPVENAVPVAAPAVEADTASIEEKEKMEAMASRLDALERVVQGFQESVATKEDLDSLKKALQDDFRAQLAKAPAVKTPSKPVALRKETVRQEPAPALRWVLKSAKPDMAWIAPAGSSELQTVRVGDTVQGLGKITSISKDSAGKWIVNGTKGRINQ